MTAKRQSADRPDTGDLPTLEYVRAFQRLVGEVFRLHGQLLTTADKLSKDLKISTARWQLIATIRNQSMTAAQIARRIGISRQGTQQTVNRLLRQHLVELLPNPDHRRSPLVALTAAGQATMDVLRERQCFLTDAFTHDLDLSLEQVEAMTLNLTALREHAENIDLKRYAALKSRPRTDKD